MIRVVVLAVVAVLVGVLTAGLALPAVAGIGIATRNAIGTITFSDLPASLQAPPLSQRSVILASDGSTLATFYYENRQSVPLSDVSPIMRQAIVAIEDSRFYEHHGVDPRGILRALVKDTSSGDAVQGASTITQQYVRQALVETNAQDNNTAGANAARAKNLSRKLREARYALALEQKLTKDQILEDYLNTVYFGSGAYGISAAAQHYFHEPVTSLTLSQSALLAGVINNPSTFDPTLNPKNALARRNIVLDRMLATYPGSYTTAQIDEAKQAPLDLHVLPIPNGCSTASAAFFCDYVVHDLLNGAIDPNGTTADRANLLRRGGLVVSTTLDPAVQASAQAAVNTVVPPDPSKNAGLAAAIDMIDPKTGAIKAMAIDRAYGTGLGQTELNLATDYVKHGGSQGRNAGSTFKVFVLAAALAKGLPTGLTFNSPGHLIIPANSTTNCDGLPTGKFDVHNAEVAEGGSFNMVTATAASVNSYFAQLEVKTGLCDPITIAQAMGVHKATGGDLDQVPAFVLGAEPVDPLSVAGAFATFANQGTFCSPQSITKVTWLVGTTTTVSTPKLNCQRVLDPDIANGVTSLLEGVLQPGGTGAGLGLGRPAAGKTGTDDDYKNAWFSGYTPNLAASVWVGNPDSTTPMRSITVNGKAISRVFGATLPGPIWQLAMKGALKNQPVENFQNAPDVVLRGPPIKIPDLAGQDPKAAAATLTGLGLLPALDPTLVNSDQAAGTVASTDPAAGSTVYAGKAVKIQISNGIPLTPTSPPPGSIPPGSAPPGSATPDPSPTPTTSPSPTVSPSPTSSKKKHH
jgi:membrane peptidoglycan carboxypeptidase